MLIFNKISVNHIEEGLFKIKYLPQGNDYTHTEYNHANNRVYRDVWLITPY